jgi:hypothetical protein
VVPGDAQACLGGAPHSEDELGDPGAGEGGPVECGGDGVGECRLDGLQAAFVCWALEDVFDLLN